MDLWKCIACLCLGAILATSFQKINFSKKFSPSTANCGAVINARGAMGPDTFDRAIECIKAGYKNVYWGDIAAVIYERVPELYEKQEIQVINLENGGFILYTKKGIKDAHLLEKRLNNEPYKNHYLMGLLLGYSEEDIKFFYDRNKIPGFENDKNDASKWIASNSEEKE